MYVEAVTSHFRFNFALRRILLQHYDEVKQEKANTTTRVHPKYIFSRYNCCRKRNGSQSNGLERQKNICSRKPHTRALVERIEQKIAVSAENVETSITKHYTTAKEMAAQERI